MPVKTVTAETIATMAAKEAVKELRKELEKEKRVKTFRNTKKT